MNTPNIQAISQHRQATRNATARMIRELKRHLQQEGRATPEAIERVRAGMYHMYQTPKR
jgi:hypothetical protein